MAKASPKIKWKQKVDKDKVESSMEYLSLLFKKEELKKIRKELESKKNKPKMYEAKNLLRASGLNPLSSNNNKVAEKIEMVFAGKPLDPAIIIGIDNQLFIADGYHHVCACYNLGEETKVSCMHV